MILPPLVAVVCLLAPAAASPVPPGGPQITEFMASNLETLADGDGDASDWIEIHNPTGATLDLDGYHLTDDALVLTKWTFPPVSLDPGEHLVVFASDKAASPPRGELHTNFKLSTAGEYLALVDPDGTTVVCEFGPVYPQQYPDVSYGLVPDPLDPQQFLNRFFGTPTPDGTNGAGFVGVVEDTDFSENRGLYTFPTTVAITAVPPTATIHYTTDGSPPSETHGTPYAGPIPISTTTVLRAMAFQTDWLSTNVDTHTYIYLDDVVRQPAVVAGYPNDPYDVGDDTDEAPHDHGMDPDVVDDPDYTADLMTGLTAIPTVALATDVATMFGTDGFYDGVDVEMPCSVEVIYPSDPPASHQADAGIEGHSHVRLKRSLRLNFRSTHGDAKWETDLLERAPFAGTSAADGFDRVVLRAGNNRSWARNWNPDKTAYTIDQLYRDSQLAVSGHGVRGTFVHLYINGLYWGLYNLVERADKFFQSAYFGGDPDDWFARNHSDELSGDSSRWDYLVDDLVFQDLDQPASYAELREYLDVGSFCDYIILAFWTGLDDWPWNNWYGGNRNATSPLGTTPARFFCWDGEWAWDAQKDFPNPEGGARVHPWFEADHSVDSHNEDIPRIWHGARANADFMMTFADRVFALLFDGGALSDEVARGRWATLNDFIRDAVVAESARWGDALESLGEPLRTRDDDWQSEVDVIDATLDGNAGRLVDALRAEGFYPSVDPPVVNHPGGVVGPGFELTFDAPDGRGTIWYTLDGTDPRASGGLVSPTARNACRFLEAVFTNGATLSGQAMTPVSFKLPIDGLTRLKARIQRHREWSPLLDRIYTPSEPKLRLTELMYHPTAPTSAELAAGFTDADQFEFLELANVGNDEVALTGVSLVTGVTFAFGPGATLAPGARIVLVRDAAAALARHGAGLPIAGVYSGKLSNGGEALQLLDSEGATLHAFSYDDAIPWPTTPDGGGPSLEVIDTEGDYGDPTNWRAGPVGGSPGS